MNTIKQRDFEYAFSMESDPEIRTQHAGAVQVPDGFLFYVAGINEVVQSDTDWLEVFAERIQYYFETETGQDPRDALRNALIYTNGYLNMQAAKSNLDGLGEMSCCLMLEQDSKLYYAWVGQISLLLYDGKKLHPLHWEVFDNNPEGAAAPWQLVFLGNQALIEPGVCTQALQPGSSDMVLMGCGGFSLEPDERQIRKILSDSMPTHTKVQRLVKTDPDEPIPSALLLLKFYYPADSGRSFASPDSSVSHPANTPRLSKKTFLKRLLIGLAMLAIAFMVYDLFLKNPKPAVRSEKSKAVASVSEESEQSPASDQRASAAEQAERADALAVVARFPEDKSYTVKAGDTWGRIYSEFEVCSWFIRNHSPNSGKFDRDGNPVAGSLLLIPVKYSASQSLNPDFYQEFGLDKVGNSCQNANRSFLRQFENRFR